MKGNANTLAYFDTAAFTALKSFVVLTLGASVLSLFVFVAGAK
jgi:hypothetical protein